jgi:hypothetical protein
VLYLAGIYHIFAAMGKLSMAASVLCMALLALAVVTIGEAAVVEHTFFVSLYIYIQSLCEQ